jgi:hypothetical protein
MNNSLNNIIKVNNTVDPQAYLSDPMNKSNYLPQNAIEFMVSINSLLKSSENVNYGEIFKLIRSHLDKDLIGENKKGENMNKKLEQIIRKEVRKIIKENDESYGKKDYERDVAWLQKALGDNGINLDNEKPKKKETLKKDEQQYVKNIVKTLKDDFGVDMKSSAFQNFDKATKLRWLTTAYLSEKDPNFLEREVLNYVDDLQDAAREQGILDDELLDELDELQGLLMKDPGASTAFSEYLQREVQETMDQMPQDQLDNLMAFAQDVFQDVPGGVMKYNRQGEPVPSDVMDWMKRRQKSKQFTGGGDPLTGGGSSFDRFVAGVDHPDYPPEK